MPRAADESAEAESCAEPVGGADVQPTKPPKDSVANVSQIVALDKSFFTGRVGKLSAPKLELVLSGIDVVLGDRPFRKNLVAAATSRVTGRTDAV